MKGFKFLQALNDHWRSGMGRGLAGSDIIFRAGTEDYLPFEIKQEPTSSGATRTVVYLMEAGK